MSRQATITATDSPASVIVHSKTMTSLEIAELTGKRHDHVMRDIRTMEVTLRKASSDSPDLGWHCESATYTDSRGKKRNMFLLDKETTLTLLSGYDVVARLKIIKRWSILETERAEEEANPELAVRRGNARAARTWGKQGKSVEWIEKRITSIATRKAFTRILAKHGVSGDGFRNCTNVIYTRMYGGSSTAVRAKKKLKPTESIRDNMSMVELGVILLTEAIAAETIERQQINGNGACELICGSTAKVIADSVIAARKAGEPTQQVLPLNSPL